MDIYIVLDGARVVGASTKLQGAEVIRADEDKRMQCHNYLRIENHELQDAEDDQQSLISQLKEAVREAFAADDGTSDEPSIGVHYRGKATGLQTAIDIVEGRHA